MKHNDYSIGEAAALVNMTSETLRHYDRIGLVKPSRVDADTKYRYYDAADLVRLNTVHALQQMELPLREIKRVLEYDDLEKIIAFLARAEQKADEKIAGLEQSKAKIRRARADYEKKLRGRQAAEGIFTQVLAARTIMLADPVQRVTADDLWGYLRHFYRRLDEDQREQFAFEDLAGVYREGDRARYFAVCTRWTQTGGLIALPAGTYLCADCTEDSRQETLDRLLEAAGRQYHMTPRFSLQLVVLSGILQWNYQLQVYVGG